MRLTTAALILLVITLIGSMMVGYRLFRMTQIRGWTPGARTEIYTITQMDKTRGRRDDHYWVSWSRDKNVRDAGNHRVMLEYENWSKLRIGSQIEITYIGNNDTPYAMDDASDFDFFFDGMLLLVSLAVAFFAGQYFVTQSD